MTADEVIFEGGAVLGSHTDSALLSVDANVIDVPDIPVGHPGRTESNGETRFDVTSDNDRDGLSGYTETNLGTDPERFDTDGDLLGDGYEAQYGLDPLTPDDLSSDEDGEGLTLFSEVVHFTNPRNPDSDGDGVSDADEVAQGSNPNDPSDGGVAPPQDGTVDVELVVGDPSGSHSERYDLQIRELTGSHRLTHQAPEFGVVETDVYRFRKGTVYEAEIIHRGTKLRSPDYDYEAGIRTAGETDKIAVDDPEDILRLDGSSTFFFADGKTAKFYIPDGNLVARQVNGNDVSEDDEVTAGVFLFEQAGSSDPAEPPPANTDGMSRLVIESMRNEFQGSHYTLTFDASFIAIYVSEAGGLRRYEQNEQLDATQQHTLWVAATHEFTQNPWFAQAVQLDWEGFGGTVRDLDRVKYVIESVDFDVDSDNDGTINRSEWEEELEEDEYGIGHLIYQGNTGATASKAIFRIAEGLDPADNSYSVRFELDPNATAGTIGVRRANGVDVLQPNTSHTLDQLDYDPLTGEITVTLIGLSENLTLATMNGVVDQGGRPDAYVDAHFEINGTSMSSDRVKYLVTSDKRFFSALQHGGKESGATLRAGIAAHLVYNSQDGKAYGLKRLSTQELFDLGVPQQAIAILTGGFHAHGFNAELYHDHVSDSYILAYQGTDATSLQDWASNISQALGLGSGQYDQAMLLARLMAETPIGNRLSFAGHSLGGGLASAAAVVTGIHADTFNAAGLKVDTLYVDGNVTNDVADLIYGPASLQRYNNAANGLVSAYYVDKDILSDLQDNLVTGAAAQSAIGVRKEMDGPYDFASNAADTAWWLSWAGGPVSNLAAAGAGVYFQINAHLAPAYLYGLLTTENDYGTIVEDLYGWDGNRDPQP